MPEDVRSVARVDSSTPVCGIVMPISALDDCSEAHWVDVLGIISDAIREAGYKPNIVSNADEAGIIQKRIIQNLYDNEIVVCDVSGKNPNVMFELGMRLAFDKPTIVVKDDRTDYSFDTSPIEHLPYPRDLRFSRIVEFKNKLSDKIAATVRASKSDTNYTTFLKHFGEFKVASLEQKEVGPQEFLIEEIQEIRKTLRRLEIKSGRLPNSKIRNEAPDNGICLIGLDEGSASKARQIARDHPSVEAAALYPAGNHQHLVFELHDPRASDTRQVKNEIVQEIRSRFPDTFGVR